jgi:hypothetical protein
MTGQVIGGVMEKISYKHYKTSLETARGQDWNLPVYDITYDRGRVLNILT